MCQAHYYPNFQVNGPIAGTPVCPELGVSWSVDMFMMPSLEWKSQRYDGLYGQAEWMDDCESIRNEGSDGGGSSQGRG